jgi:drug/metabolite transporter (DMT)-like permease
MNERFGVAVAILSCSFGAGAAVATRYLIGGADPVTIAAIRFGGGALCLWPLALGLRVAWPRGRDRIAVAALGVLFFAVFFVFYNLALRYTTVARGTLALSMLPLMTMAAGAALGIEALTRRKTAGVLIAIGGVAVALASGVAAAPAGAWRGDLIMAAATLCMALYSVWSRPFVMRSSALGFLTAGMTAGRPPGPRLHHRSRYGDRRRWPRCRRKRPGRYHRCHLSLGRQTEQLARHARGRHHRGDHPQ